MLIHDLDLHRSPIHPREIDAPLVVDPDRMLPGASATELFQSISRRESQFAEIGDIGGQLFPSAQDHDWLCNTGASSVPGITLIVTRGVRGGGRHGGPRLAVATAVELVALAELLGCGSSFLYHATARSHLPVRLVQGQDSRSCLRDL